MAIRVVENGKRRREAKRFRGLLVKHHFEFGRTL
jgi:hypothetical protein